MFPVQVHLILNHVPLTGLVFGLVFYILGIKKSSEAELLTGEKVFIAMEAISFPILASGLRSAHALSATQWLDTLAVHSYQRAGILTLIVIIVPGILSGIILMRSRGGHKVGFVRLRKAILVLAMVSFVMVLWSRGWAANSGTASLDQDRRPPVPRILDPRGLCALRRTMSNIDRPEGP